MNNILRNTKKIFTNNSISGGSDPTLSARVTVLENNELKITYFTTITSTTGTISIPTGATILLDQLAAGADAYVSTIQNGQPTGSFPKTSGGVTVDISTFDALGNYTLTGTPSSFPVALIYVLKIKEVNYSNLTITNILDLEDTGSFLFTGAAGANTQIQFNNSGALGASSNFTWNTSTNTLFISGTTNSFVMSSDSGSGFIQMVSSGGFTIYNQAGNAGIALSNSGTTNIFVSSGIVTTFQSGSAKFAASIDGSGGYFQPLIGGLGMALYNAAGTSSISVDGAGGSTITNNLKVASGTVNIGNAVITNQRITRIGQDTAFVDIGSRVGATSLGAIYINQTTPNAFNFSIAQDATNLLINSPAAGSTTTFLSNGSTWMVGSANNITFSPVAVTVGAITNFIFTKPNNTNQTASANIPGLIYNGGTRQWATGAIATQVENLWAATTYTAVAASVITTAIGNDFFAPIASTNITITNNYAIRSNGNILLNFGSNPTIESPTSVRLKAGSSAEVFFDINGVNAVIRTSNTLWQWTDGLNQSFSVTNGSKIGTSVSQKIGFWNATPVVQQTGGAATAGVAYTTTEQAMLNALYSMARTTGLLS